jgi:hypothetical protein
MHTGAKQFSRLTDKIQRIAAQIHVDPRSRYGALLKNAKLGRANVPAAYFSKRRDSCLEIFH